MNNFAHNFIFTPKNPSTHYDIVIIGGGFAGSLVAANLSRDGGNNLSFALIERQKHFGTGAAYGTKNIHHLLNVPVNNMSAFPDDPDHFLRWLRENGYPSDDRADFAPRLVYGKYIRSILEEATDNSTADRFHIIKDEAVFLSVNGGIATITLRGGRTLDANKVVLAVGNFPAATPKPLTSLTSRYIRDGWESEAIADLAPDDPILLIGTGLTMVDAVVSLRQQGFKGKIHAIARHGLRPVCHQRTNPYPCFLDLETAPRTTRGLLRRIREEVNQAEAKGYDWRSVLNALRPITQALWQSLPLAEQKRFCRHVKPYWENMRHRIPEEMGTLLDEAVELGQLTYHAGRVQAWREKEGRVEITIRERKTGLTSVLSVARTINCTGSNTDYRTLKDPLIITLLEAGLIRPHPLGFGIETSADGAIVGADGSIDRVLYTLGTPRKGDLWETTAIPEIRIQAAQMAADFIEWGRARPLLTALKNLPKLN